MKAKKDEVALVLFHCCFDSGYFLFSQYVYVATMTPASTGASNELQKTE